MSAFIAVIAAALAMAQDAPARPESPFSNAEFIDVASEGAEYLPSEGKTIFTGNVRVVSGGAVLTAPRIVVTQTGEQGDVALIEATGGVRYAREGEAISGRRAVYDGKARTITVYDDVLLAQGRQVARGARLVYHLDTERVQLFSAPGARVRGLFFSGSEPDA